MIKKIGVIALALGLILAILSPGLVQAQGGLTVLNSSATAMFPYQLNFSLSASSDVNITDIRLCYTVDRAGFAEVISEGYIEFTPDTSVEVSWSLSMVYVGGLPPGSTVEYWWKVEDASGDSIETAPSSIQFNDVRYSWSSLTEGQVTIYWYQGDESFAQELMAAAQQALVRLAEDTGAELERPVQLFIYANSDDLRGAMIYPQEWTGGVAYTRHGIMAIGISDANTTWGKRAIAHELTHLVIHQMTLNPYNQLPTWLDEGLAMHAEGELEPGLASYLEMAVADDSLISVQSLCSPFSAYAEEAYLSYAQSYSLVEFLIDTYGQVKMLELLNVFREGSGYAAALESVYGFDMDGLDGLWRDYIVERYQLTSENGIPPVWIAVLVILATGLVVALGLVIRILIRKQGR
ncbi:MAG TPA: peptidase MA domain-containing protein [Dehalococcoidia bacterium]|nr:peptidase MA domain-containing protein [Dehalococcoidia bacterium]